MGIPRDQSLTEARERALRLALERLNESLERMFERAEIETPADLQKVSGLSPHIAAKVIRGQMKDPPLSTLLTLMVALNLRSLEELLAPLGSSEVVEAWHRGE